ncbi:NUDIX domain-containing protein [Sporosarcina oncorhynchi]|uniref:NUDIX domain-containing protein n=1 Tax=Sporosarcina oncorhynchi TaxID=3056444 RepID=A0ABZ0L4R4_9BACL|nr:NUDIX domain-containing protein [Sporosarcina sp. T2O-4]WOV87197.1 NUDIX domain-containing protein [Sporosarcina sp. T2O-4]
MEEKDLQKLSETEFIDQYKKTEKDKYEKPSIATDMAIFTVATKKVTDNRKKADKELQVLLIRRGGHPYKGDWALAGGFMGIDEDVETAVQRELKEETGVDGVYAEQLYTWSAVDRDPRMRIVSVSYLALVDQEKLPPLQAGDDAEDVRWFTVKDRVTESRDERVDGTVTRTEKIELKLVSGEVIVSGTIEKITVTEGANTRTAVTIIERNGIAFDHTEIILYSLERLRGKVNYTNIAFNLAGEEFTLPDLQQIYEVILDKELNKVQFRRHVENMVVDTGKEIKTGAYRPSKLYRYNAAWVYEQWK